MFGQFLNQRSAFPGARVTAAAILGVAVVASTASCTSGSGDHDATAAAARSGSTHNSASVTVTGKSGGADRPTSTATGGVHSTGTVTAHPSANGPSPASSESGGVRSSRLPTNVPDGQKYVRPSLAPAPSVTLPAATHDRTNKSAVTFVKSYARALNAAFRDPEKSRLDDWGSNSCVGCSAYVKQLQALAQGKWRAMNDLITLAEPNASQGKLGQLVVTASGTEAGLKIVNPQGFVSEAKSTGRHVYHFSLSWTGSRWVISALAKTDG